MEQVEIPTILIRPSRGWIALKLGDIWEYRELLYFLVWRDIKVRYKQTALGATWAVIQPFFSMIVFSLFFGKLAKMPSDGIPYPIFSYAALVPWTYFAGALSQSANSLVDSANLIRKVYFPRLTIPIANSSGGAGRFRHRICRPAGTDVLVRHHADVANHLAPGLPAAGPRHRPGGRALALGAERRIP